MRVADEHGARRLGPGLVDQRLQSGRRRLARICAVAANDGKKERRHVEMGEEARRRGQWFVGEDRERDSSRKRVQHLGDAVVEARRVEEAPVVDSQIMPERLVEIGVDAGGGEDARDQQPRAIANHGGDIALGQRAGAVRGQHLIRRRGEVRARVDEGPVEIEDDEFRRRCRA